MTLFLIEYHGDDAGIKQGFSLLEDTVGNPRTEFPRSELLHFLQDAQDFAPVRGRFPGVRRVAGAPRARAVASGGSHGNGPDEFPAELYPITPSQSADSVLEAINVGYRPKGDIQGSYD